MKDAPGDGRRVDLVLVRSASAVALSGASLVLFVTGVKLSLLPLAFALMLLTRGKSVRGRMAPPVAFLIMVPMIIGIVIVAIQRL